MSAPDPLAVSLALAAAANEVERMRRERDIARASRDYWTERTAEAEDAYGDAAEMLAHVAAERDAILDAWQRADEFKGWAQYDAALDACQRRIAGLLGSRERQVLAVATAKLEAILASGTVLGVAARILREVHADLTALTSSDEPKETP